MKILFLTDLCPISDFESGLPVTLLNFILDFKALYAEVVLLRLNIIPNVLLRGRKVLKEGTYNYKGIKCINKNYFTPFFNEKQFEFLKEEKFDIILSHMPSGILAARAISLALNIPYALAVHSSDIHVLSDFKYSFLRNKMKDAYKNAIKVLPRSFWLKDKIEEIIPETKGKTFVIPSGIEKEAIIEDMELDLKIKKMPLNKIFSCGKLVKRKNFEPLIFALSDIFDIELKIAGSGFLEKKLKKIIKKLNLDKNVELIGFKNKEEVYALMENSGIFVLPSLNETFGMVYLEAMAKGCIVICTENSGMAGFIEDGVNGFLVKPFSSDIKNCILKIKSLKNPEIIMKNAVETAKKMERLKMSENYLKLVQNIIF